jgi:hypothetical protein
MKYACSKKIDSRRDAHFVLIRMQVIGVKCAPNLPTVLNIGA